MKNHTKSNADPDVDVHNADKEEKPAAGHGHGHAHGHEKAGKHAPAAAPAQVEADKPAGKKDEAMAVRLAELEDSKLRLLADFDNYRKRSVRDREAAVRLARENMLVEFLPVIDNIELGINAAMSHNVDKAFVEGYRMVADQLTAALARFGLKPQDAEGAQFDPNLHEAIQQVPSDEHEAGKVISVARRGYLSGDAVLRPAQVVVSSGPVASGGAAAPTNEETRASAQDCGL
ncbi:MAG: nucleotide exchange factor GrpE [bacterium]